jgi:hypothetical protein
MRCSRPSHCGAGGASWASFLAPPPPEHKDRESSIFVDPGLAGGRWAPNMPLLQTDDRLPKSRILGRLTKGGSVRAILVWAVCVANAKGPESLSPVSGRQIRPCRPLQKPTQDEGDALLLTPTKVASGLQVGMPAGPNIARFLFPMVLEGGCDTDTPRLIDCQRYLKFWKSKPIEESPGGRTFGWFLLSGPALELGGARTSHNLLVTNRFRRTKGRLQPGLHPLIWNFGGSFCPGMH